MLTFYFGGASWLLLLALVLLIWRSERRNTEVRQTSAMIKNHVLGNFRMVLSACFVETYARRTVTYTIIRRSTRVRCRRMQTGLTRLFGGGSEPFWLTDYYRIMLDASSAIRQGGSMGRAIWNLT